MKNILVLGAGSSAGFLVHQLLADAEANDWFVTVGDLDLDLARAAVGEHPRGTAIRFDVGDAEMTSAHVERATVVVNMLPQSFQPALAWSCLQHGKHMVSVSYRDREMTAMEEEVQRNGLLFLTEVGLDPGIDLMSAARQLQEIEARGGRVERFESYGAGLPSLADAPNPVRYCITWNPRNVAMAGESGAQYLEDGKVKILPWHKLFRHTWTKEVPGIGLMEAYPNRDSLAYREVLRLEETRTLVRGTLRYPGWCGTWARIVELGLPNERIVIPELGRRSWAEIVEMFLPRDVPGAGIEERVARYLGIDFDGSEMENLRWLGLFDEEVAGIRGTTAADAVVHLLRTRLPLPPNGRDQVVLFHDVVVRYPEGEGRRERRRSTLVAEGEPGGFTAMARTVGQPAAIAVRLLVRGELPLTGCRIPTHPAIYEPILAELEATGLGFQETIEEITEETS